MKVLFLDDSYQRNENYLGYGGFIIDEDNLRILVSDILSMKSDFQIPRWVELKWSPGPKHFLRQKFTGSRHELYQKAVGLLKKHKATIICAVHDLNDCYGVRNYNWSFERTRLWATKQQFKFIVERFEEPCLSNTDSFGLVIADHYSNVEGESSLIRETTLDFERGTDYRQFERICMPPLTADPWDCSPLQMADIIVGIIVAALVGNRFALDLYEDVAVLFLTDPHKDAISFASVMSSDILGYGLKLFPPSFRDQGRNLFKELDRKYIYTNEGLKVRNN